MFSGIVKFVNRYYSKFVDACIVATLFSLWSHETFGKSHQLLALGAMIVFSSAAIVGYFVRLFSIPADQDGAVVEPSPRVEGRDELAPTRSEAVGLPNSVRDEESEYLCRVADVGAGQPAFGPGTTYSVAFAAIVGSFVETREEAYVRRVTEIINALSTNPHGIEYEFYFKPDVGLRITKVGPAERKVFTEEFAAAIEPSVPRPN